MGLRRLISYYFSSNGNQSATTPTSPANLKENLDKSMLNFEEHSSFLKWLVGFTDAEGNFSIFSDKGYIRFRYKITMHIDNLNVLKYIHHILGVGNVVIEEAPCGAPKGSQGPPPGRNRCSFVVQDFASIRDVICPIFVQYPLITSKILDFQDFHKAVILKNKSHLSDADKKHIIYLKNGMNSKRVIFKNYSIDSQINISPEWFIGFMEGEGTFGIKTGSSMYLQVAQKNTSMESINGIINFLTSLKTTLPQNTRILPLNVVSTTNIRTNVVSLVISSIDALYYYILPLLDTAVMYTDKATDFKLWRMALILKIQGYYLLPEGKKLFLDISDILNKRSSTGSLENVDAVIADIINRYQAILLTTPTFNVEANIPHTDNVRKFRLDNKSNMPKSIFVYKNGSLIEGSPFNSFSATHKPTKISNGPPTKSAGNIIIRSYYFQLSSLK